MKVTKSLLMMLSLAVFVFAVPLTSKADEMNKETILTFNQPVEIPGMVLAPGAYVFKLLDSPGTSNVVQIYNAGETHLYENVFAIPAYRATPSDQPVVTLDETVEGNPRAVGTWFYPGDNYGERFLYGGTKTTNAAARSTTPSAAMPQAESK